MKITLDWLKRHLDTEASADEIADTLNRIGLEVDGVTDRARELAPFVVGYVVEAKQHPNADKLRVCVVDNGTETVQVVCGAPNARTGMKGVFAASGLTIPGTDMKLKPSKIRGEESNGMLCSEREMGLSDEHDGIIELPEDAVVGEPFAAYMGLDDAVLDISITPDRGDCLGVRGIARDLAAAGMGTLKPLDTTPVKGTFKSPMAIKLDFDDETKDACSLFIGRYFKGLKNGPSPAWMQQKLIAVGLRPISALVDITNWVTLDIGRPAHIYDADKVKGTIGARLAKSGETFLALNGKDYEADDEMTAIVDESGMLGLGGIIGGESTSAEEDTVNGFLEIALFDPLRTAATGRKLALDTDARHRFERGVDGAFAPDGMEIATRLVLEICGGEASEPVIAGAVPTDHQTMAVRPSRVLSLGGIDIAKAESERILGDLGYGVRDAADDRWDVTVPTWRHDMQCEADVIEEILRINGFDAIEPVSLPRLSAYAKPILTLLQKRVRWARRALAGRGMNEAVTYSFVPRTHAQLFGGVDDDLVLENPISADMDVLRPSGLPALMAAAGRNLARGQRDFGLFEIGPAYVDRTPKGQMTSVAGIRVGASGPRNWLEGERPVDAFDAKADALAVLDAVGAPVDKAQTTTDAPAWFHPGRSGVLRLGPNVLAAFGEISPAVLKAIDIDGPIVGFEVMLEHVPAPKSKTFTRPALDISQLQAVERDFAFLVDADVPAEKVVRAAAVAERDLITAVNVFDLFEGPSLGEGQKSIAISVHMLPRERTLTDDEIDAVAAKVVAAVEKNTGGKLRG